MSALLPTEHFVPPGRKHADLSQQPLFRDGSAPSSSPLSGRPLQLTVPLSPPATGCVRLRPPATGCDRLLWPPMMSALMLRCLTNTSYPGSPAMRGLRSPPSLLSFSSFQSFLLATRAPTSVSLSSFSKDRSSIAEASEPD